MNDITVTAQGCYLGLYLTFDQLSIAPLELSYGSLVQVTIQGVVPLVENCSLFLQSRLQPHCFQHLATDALDQQRGIIKHFQPTRAMRTGKKTATTGQRNWRATLKKAEQPLGKKSRATLRYLIITSYNPNTLNCGLLSFPTVGFISIQAVPTLS